MLIRNDINLIDTLSFSYTGTYHIINALIFGIVASEIVLLTNSIASVIILHAMYDFVNWIALIKSATEVIVILIQSVILIIYAIYLWNELPDKQG